MLDVMNTLHEMSLSVGVELQSAQIAELLRVIEQQNNHLEQYRAVLDAQRVANTSLNADCEKIQARSACTFCL